MSLDSLDLYATDQMNILINTKLSTKTEKRYLDNTYYISKKTSYSIHETLYLINAINNMIIDDHIKATINNILTDYSSFYPNKQYLASLHTKQYIDRFKYKYQYFCKNKSNKSILLKHNRVESIYQIAIMQLYILNKISINEGPYILYKYLQSKEKNLSAKF